MKGLRFNPRAHAGRDQSERLGTRARQSFNPRAHAGRDRSTEHRAAIRWAFQSTRPRGARLGYAGYALRHLEVSIHAPTRGATSATAWRSQCKRCFNPRAHAGRDMSDEDRSDYAERVSIHAPTRGATSADKAGQPRAASFNPRAHAGRDPRAHCIRAGQRAVSIHAPTRGATAGEGGRSASG